MVVIRGTYNKVEGVRRVSNVRLIDWPFIITKDGAKSLVEKTVK
jgi:hypothetical protein